MEAGLTASGDPAADKLIRQRLASDCAICTIAMAIGRSYEDVLEAALRTDAFDPTKGCRAEYRVLEAFGLEQMRDFRVMHRMCLAPEFFLHFSWGRRAILAVPSLNLEDSFHSAFWTGSELLDPCTKKTYQRWSDLRPDEIILIAETGAHPDDRRR